MYLLTEEGKAALRDEALDRAQRRILMEVLRHPNGVRETTLHKRGPATIDALVAMDRKGWVTKHEVTSRRGQGHPVSPTSKKTQGPEAELAPQSLEWTQHALPDSLWRNGLAEVIETGGFAPILLHAPLEHRLDCLRRAVVSLAAKQTAALVVTGETERAKLLYHILAKSGGPPAVFLHGGLSDAERRAAWRTIQQGEFGVVIGTRSAVFAPLPRLGLIWVEGEEDPSLKEEQTPHYHARDVGWWRARQEQAVLVLASSHPSIETVMRVRDEGLVLELPDDRWEYPAVTVVNLRDAPRDRLLTTPMVRGIEDSLRQEAGAVLFLNRKGYGGALVCRDCGTVVQCPRCSVAATYYRRAAYLLCHYCGQRRSPPETCLVCAASRLDLVGFGTERLEEEIRRLFPRIRVARLDREEAPAAQRSAAIVRLLWAGELDLVIGTQMLFQRGLLPKVGFVGVPHADGGLQVPDFRSAERTYGGLLDALLLARPAACGGRAVIQTALASHHAIAAAIGSDSQRFYQSEAAVREILGYPPAMHLIRLSVTGKDAAIAERAASGWHSLLQEAAAGGSARDREHAGALRPADGKEIEVLGPAPAPVPRVRGRYVWHLLVKSRRRELALQTVRTTLEWRERLPGVRLDVDVDPIQFT